MPSQTDQISTLHVIKLRNVEDESTGDAYIEFKFKKTCNRTGNVIVPRDQADDVDTLLPLLKRKNADLPACKREVCAIIKAAIDAPPQQHTLLVKHVGWRRHRKTFIVGRKVIGAPKGSLTTKPPLWLDDHPAQVFRSRGSLDAWKRQVAKPARYSAPLRLAILASFAAPLVHASGLQNFAINFFGRAKVGKTALLLAATSMYGIGRERDLPNWNSTSGAFMEIARGYNDLMLPGNEVGLIEGKKRDAYAVIRTRIYAFAEGRDRSRMAKTSITTPKGSATYRGITVSTAEYPFEEYAAMSGEQRSPGEYARAMDVPAVRPGHPTIFDGYPKGIPVAARQEWARAQVIKLRRACEHQHGTAIEPYINFIIRLGDQLPLRVRAYLKEFMGQVQAMHLDPALEHAARNFGLMFAGGYLGIQAGVLPWSEKRVLTSVLNCFVAAVAVIRGQDTLESAKQTLATRLRSGDVVAATDGTRSGPGDYVGYYKKMDGKMQFTIHSAAFRSWFKNRAECAAILRWLKDKGLLIIGSKAAQPSRASTEWAERTPRWPDGSARRSFTFGDPFRTEKATGKA